MNSLTIAQLMVTKNKKINLVSTESLFLCLKLVGVSGFFLPLMLKNPLAKIEMNGRLVAPSYTHPAVSIMKNSTTTGFLLININILKQTNLIRQCFRIKHHHGQY